MSACIWEDCDVPAITQDGFCGHHHWVAIAEFELGHHQIRGYLESWAAYQAWCAEHEREAA